MKVKDAIAMLEDAPDNDIPSKVKPSLTTSQVLNIVIAGLPSGANTELSDIFEKRVYQATRNQLRPIY